MKTIISIVFISISLLSNAQTFLDSVRSGKITMYEYVEKSNELDKFNNNIVPFKENGKWGFKDKNSTTLIMPKYDYASSFQNGVASVKLNGKCGLINKFDNLVIPYDRYDEIYLYKEKRARVKKNNLFGIIDNNGKEILPCIYKSLDNYRFGFCQLTDKNNKEGIVDLNGNIVIPFIYDELSPMELDGY